jgi:hypothetical protein
MRKWLFLAVLLGLISYCERFSLAQQPSPDSKSTTPESKPADRPGSEFSGMYSFLKEGEFVQVTVEDAGHVTGFVSRFGDLESDRGSFLDQFFKTGKLQGNDLAFTTEVVHGTAFDFKGTFERGEGKKPGDEGYYILKGKLTERTTDANQKQSSKTREVTFKGFPADASTEPAARD